MGYLYFVLVVILGAMSCGQMVATSQFNSTECSFTHQRAVLTYSGWPVRITCEKLYDFHLYSVYSDYTSSPDSIECVVSDPSHNSIIWNATANLTSYFYSFPSFYTEDLLTDGQSYHVAIMLPNETCVYEEVIVNVTTLTEKSCERFSTEDAHITFPASEGHPIKLFCEVPFDIETPQIYLEYGNENFTVTWFRNCTSLDPDLFPELYRMDGSTLIINSPTYELVGVYSCGVSYKGQTRYAIQFDVCIEESYVMTPPLISCPETIIGRLGESLTIACDLSLGLGRINPIHLTSQWQQINGNNSCANLLSGTREGSGATCSMVPMGRYERKCYIYDPPEEEKEPKEKRWKVNLTISFAEESDFGEYQVIFSRLQSRVNKTILVKQREDYYQTNILIITIVLVSVFALAVIIFAVVCISRKYNFGKGSSVYA